MQPGPEMIATEDGSLTMMDSSTRELFHNRAGAYTEAVHNYLHPSNAIEEFRRTKRLAILDICFGLGYNSLVVIEEVLRLQLPGELSILAVELSSEVLNLWPSVLEDFRFETVKRECFPLLNETGFVYDDGQLNISLSIVCNDFRNVLPGLKGTYNLIFHDPFSPRHVPQLWTIDIFRHYRRLLDASRGRVLTYSSAVAVRSAFKMCGFDVYRTVAVGRKSGGTLAALDDSFCCDDVHSFHLVDDENQRLATSSATPYRDSTLGADAKTVLKARQQELSERHRR
jgi:uncharacterized protein